MWALLLLVLATLADARTPTLHLGDTGSPAADRNFAVIDSWAGVVEAGGIDNGILDVTRPPFSALGDGTTDAAAPLQAAIDAACTTGPRAVRIPRPSVAYAQSAQLLISACAGLTIMCEGGALLRTTVAGNNIRIVDSDDVTIRGCAVTTTVTPTAASAGIYAYSTAGHTTSNLTLDGIRATNLVAGIFIQGRRPTDVTETETIPGTPYRITVAHGATFFNVNSVVYTATGVPLTRVVSGPVSGEYQINIANGQFTFAAADTGLGVTISYSYTDAAPYDTNATIRGLRCSAVDQCLLATAQEYFLYEDIVTQAVSTWIPANPSHGIYISGNQLLSGSGLQQGPGTIRDIRCDGDTSGHCVQIKYATAIQGSGVQARAGLGPYKLENVSWSQFSHTLGVDIIASSLTGGLPAIDINTTNAKAADRVVFDDVHIQIRAGEDRPCFYNAATTGDYLTLRNASCERTPTAASGYCGIQAEATNGSYENIRVVNLGANAKCGMRLNSGTGHSVHGIEFTGCGANPLGVATATAYRVSDAPSGMNFSALNALFNSGTGLINGSHGIYCTDCTIASPCAGSGTGAIAKVLNGVLVCN